MQLGLRTENREQREEAPTLSLERLEMPEEVSMPTRGRRVAVTEALEGSLGRATWSPGLDAAERVTFGDNDWSEAHW